MFDLFTAIAGAFGGRVAHDEQARKLVWVLILLAGLTASITAFTAYMSYSRYFELIKHLPNAHVVAWYITIMIAVAMMIITGVLGLFTIEIWISDKDDKDGRKSRIAWQAASILFVIGLFIGITDFSMNIKGAEDVANEMAGDINGVDDQAIFDRYNDQIASHQDRIKQVHKKYTWKGNLWFQPTKYHPLAEWKQDTAIVNNANRQIAALEAAKTQALQRDTDRFNNDKVMREERRASSHETLVWAVRLAYVLQFLVMLGLAYCSLVMEKAIASSPKQSIFGKLRKTNGVTTLSPEAIDHAIQSKLAEVFANWEGNISDDIEPERDDHKPGIYKDTNMGFETGTNKKRSKASLSAEKGSKTKVKNVTRIHDIFQLNKHENFKGYTQKKKGLRKDAAKNRRKIRTAINRLEKQNQKLSIRAIMRETGLKNFNSVKDHFNAIMEEKGGNES